MVSGFGLLGFEAGAEFPDEAGEFSGDGGLDLVVMQAALAQQERSKERSSAAAQQQRQRWRVC